jgi:putative membrane protein
VNATLQQGGTLDSTEMACDRTWLAHERTLMAWVRTATSMITFGFTVYKFFQFEVAHGARSGVLTPRDFGLIMISIGLITLLLAIVSRRKQTAALSKQLRQTRRSLSEVVAILMFAFGILLLAATVLRS